MRTGAHSPLQVAILQMWDTTVFPAGLRPRRHQLESATGVCISGLSGKSCVDCAFSHRFSWVSVGKLAEKIEETSSDVIGYGMVFYAVMAYADKMWRAMPSSLSRPAECGMQVDGVSVQ